MEETSTHSIGDGMTGRPNGVYSKKTESHSITHGLTWVVTENGLEQVELPRFEEKNGEEDEIKK